MNPSDWIDIRIVKPKLGEYVIICWAGYHDRRAVIAKRIIENDWTDEVNRKFVPPTHWARVPEIPN